jgi:hypothetical protein
MVDPHGIGNSAGRAMLSFRGASITGATVQFASRGELLGDRGGARRNTFLHEMGHVMGLAHSPNPHDVMTPAVGPGSRREEFHEREAIALHMMYYHREPGNRPPDRDPQLEAAMVGRPLETVIYDCRPVTAFQR